MRIEFLGPPGAGKTSLVPVVVDELRILGLPTLELKDAVYESLRTDMRDRLLGPAIRVMPRRMGQRYYKPLAARSHDAMAALRDFTLEHPDTVIAIVEAIDDRNGVDSRQDLALGWILELLWQYEIAVRSLSPESVLVLDEGFANRALTLFGYQYSTRNEPLLRKYIEAMPKPDLVIVVGGDAKVMASRGSHRTRFGHLTAEQAVGYTRDVMACVERTSELLKQRGVHVSTVQNQGVTTKTASDAVRDVVRTWIAERSSDDEA